MSTVYLKDGSRATLVSKINDGFLVKRHLVCQKWNDDSEDEVEFIEESDQVEIVNEVFPKAPIDFIEAEYRRWLDKVSEQEKILSEIQKEKIALASEVLRLKNSKTDITRIIFNMEELRNAKRLTVFRRDRIEPHSIDPQNRLKLTISYEITSYGVGDQNCWVYNFYGDNNSGSWGSSDYYDPQYGIMPDLTDEQIKEITINRLLKKDIGGKEGFSPWALTGCSDIWLTPEIIELKKKEMLKQSENDLKNAKAELEKHQKNVERLEAKILTVS